MMKRSTKDKAEGIFHELKGTIKSKAGKLTNNRGLEAEGIVEKIAGKVQKKISQVEKAVENREADTASHHRTAPALRFRPRNRTKNGGRS
jgi:uncharacterized protein YjbJ (UPF0337 family)